jgi:hypothetical protein
VTPSELRATSFANGGTPTELRESSFADEVTRTGFQVLSSELQMTSSADGESEFELLDHGPANWRVSFADGATSSELRKT